MTVTVFFDPRRKNNHQERTTTYMVRLVPPSSIPHIISRIYYPQPRTHFAPSMAPKRAPVINSITPLPPSEAKWTQLNKIAWTDSSGRDRIWECASRKTRKSTGIDAVAIAPILRYPSKPPATLLILQYRPPVQSVCVEFPAGLIDEGESCEEAAVRELREETGLRGKVVDVSPTIVSDPGLTDANMRMVTIEVAMGEEGLPEQELDEGEDIERRVVVLSELHETLEALSKEEGVIVDSKLYHWSLGMRWSQKIAKM